MLGLSGAAAMRRSASADRVPAAAATALAAPCSQPPALAALAPALVGRQQRRLALHFRGYRLGLPVPSELWGAAVLAVRLAQPGIAGPAPQLRRTASIIAQAFSAAASPPLPPPPAGQVSVGDPKALAAALDWRPQLSTAEDLACLLMPAAVCAGVYAATAPATIRLLYAAGMALLYALLIAVLRTGLLERHYRAVQRSERELAAADSRFFPVDGIRLHYKRHAPLKGGRGGGGGWDSGDSCSRGDGSGGQDGRAPTVVHCLHGFGASTYSWSFVQQELADVLCAAVTAHDMPGFGLSERPRNPSYYTLHFNGDAARRILDAELAAQQAGRGGLQPPPPRQPLAGQQRQGQGQQRGRPGELRSHPISFSSSSTSLTGSDAEAVGRGEEDSAAGGGGADGTAHAERQTQQARRVLIGHSMGGAAVAEGVISHPEGVAALVLVAPAIVALWPGPPEGASGDAVATGLAVVEELVAAEDPPGELRRLPSAPSSAQLLPVQRIASSSGGNGNGGGSGCGGRSVAARVRRVARAAAAVVKATLLLAVRLLLAAASPLLVLLLRRLVRSRRFWERGLASAWYDNRRVVREYVDSYRCGQLVRGWEGGLLRFLAARFAEKAGFWGSILEAVQGEGHLTQAERLACTVRRHGMRVLIVHGSNDALVPAANSRRLAALLPDAELVVFEGCGHMPQEECPERFVQAVQRFVESLG